MKNMNSLWVWSLEFDPGPTGTSYLGQLAGLRRLGLKLGGAGNSRKGKERRGVGRQGQAAEGENKFWPKSSLEIENSFSFFFKSFSNL
jgi:hypothetical protein